MFHTTKLNPDTLLQTPNHFSQTRFDLLRDEPRPAPQLKEILVESNQAEKLNSKVSNTPSSFYLETVEIISKVNSHVSLIKKHLLDSKRNSSDQHSPEQIIFPESITV